jgi:hypothetical protein
MTNLEQDLKISGHMFERVQNFRFLGALISSRNILSDKLQQGLLQVIDGFIV